MEISNGMNKKKLLKHLVLLMFFIFIANNVVWELHWYSSIWWFDMVMHFLGGLWVGLFFLYIFYAEDQLFKKFLTVFLCVLLIGVLWEFFEFFTFNYIGKDPFNALDTVSDIFFDLAGGTFALFYFFKRIILAKENEVK